MEEAWNEKTKLVLEAIVAPSTNIKDDTCLNKLVDFLQVKIHEPEDVEGCSIPVFLNYLSEKKTATHVFVFGVHIAGILAVKSHLNVLYGNHIVQVLETAFSHDFQKVPSVGEALYTVLRHSPTAVISSVKDLMTQTWKILHQKNSLFLTKSAVHFVTSYFSKHSSDFESKVADDLLVFLDKLCTYIYNIASDQNGDRQDEFQFLKVCLEILKDVMAIDCWYKLIEQKYSDLDDILLKILENAEKPLFDPCLQCLLTFAKNHRSNIQMLEDFYIKMKSYVDQLVTRDVSKVQEICIGMMHSGLWPDSIEWYKLMISLPLYLMVSMDTESEKFTLTLLHVKEQITSKTKAVKIFCGTLEKLAALEFIEEDKLLQEMVVKTFEQTTDDSGQTSEIHCYTYNSNKIQQKCHQFFIQDFKIWLPYVDRIVPVIVKICQTFGVDNVTYTRCLDSILLFLPYILQERNSDSATSSKLTDLVFIIQKNLCGISWETREATITFIHKIVTSHKCESVVLSWFEHSRFDVSVWQSLSDSESYVRSSAIDCLADIILSDRLRDHLINSLSIDIETVVDKLTNLCTTDTEAFVRRSAVSFFTSLWGNNSVIPDDSRKPILSIQSEVMSNDFDWEVKLKVLDFWSQIIDSELCLSGNLKETAPLYAVGTNLPSLFSDTLDKKSTFHAGFCNLVTWGCFKALFSMIKDFDQSVVEKALQILMNVKNISKKNIVFTDFNDFLHNIEVANGSSSENSECKKQKMSTQTENIQFPLTNVCKEDILDVFDKLMALDIEHKLSLFSQTCDEYERNPVSLLDDILLYARSHDNQDEDDSTVVDCY